MSENKERFLHHYHELIGPKLIKAKLTRPSLSSIKLAKGYATYKVLKKRYHWASWETWPEKKALLLLPLTDLLTEEEKVEFEWHCLLQFLCDVQLQEAKKYALNKKIFLMGDAPILIDRDSVDVWHRRDLFDLRYSAGAPPDIYTQAGQNWGFPSIIGKIWLNKDTSGGSIACNG